MTDTDGVRAATDAMIARTGAASTVDYFRGVVGTWQTITELALHSPQFEPIQQFAADSLALYRTELEYAIGVLRAREKHFARFRWTTTNDHTARSALAQAESDLRRARERATNQRRAYRDLERAYRRVCRAVNSASFSPQAVWDEVRRLAGDVPG